jgi:hypothetical protein
LPFSAKLVCTSILHTLVRPQLHANSASERARIICSAQSEQLLSLLLDVVLSFGGCLFDSSKEFGWCLSPLNVCFFVSWRRVFNLGRQIEGTISFLLIICRDCYIYLGYICSHLVVTYIVGMFHQVVSAVVLVTVYSHDW